MDKPELHLWETGVMRITRHPQAFGQVRSGLHGVPPGLQALVLWLAKRTLPAAWLALAARPAPMGSCSTGLVALQALWCAAHMLWIGSTFTALTSALLMGHHLFGCWHGDLRLRRKYGQVLPCTLGMPAPSWFCQKQLLNDCVLARYCAHVRHIDSCRF